MRSASRIWTLHRLARRASTRRPRSSNNFATASAAGRSRMLSTSRDAWVLGLTHHVLPRSSITFVAHRADQCQPIVNGGQRCAGHQLTNSSLHQAIFKRPATDHAAFSATSRSSQPSTLPSRLTLFPSNTLTRIAWASNCAFLASACPIFFLISDAETVGLTEIELVT